MISRFQITTDSIIVFIAWVSPDIDELDEYEVTYRSTEPTDQDEKIIVDSAQSKCSCVVLNKILL